MQFYKRAYGLAFATATLLAVVLLAVFGNADMAIMGAVVAGLVGMYVLRHYARAKLIRRGRAPSADDHSEPESRRPQRTSDRLTGVTVDDRIPRRPSDVRSVGR